MSRLRPKYQKDPAYLDNPEQVIDMKVFRRGYSRGGRESVSNTIKINSTDFYIARGILWFLNWKISDGKKVPVVSAYIQGKTIYLSNLLMGLDGDRELVEHIDQNRLNFVRNNLRRINNEQ